MKRFALVASIALMVFAIGRIEAASTWTYRSATSLTVFANDGTNSGMPLGWQVGDTLLYFTGVQASGIARTLDTSTFGGWVRLDASWDGSDNLVDAALYCRIAQMGDTAPNVTWGAGAATVSYQMIAIHGPTAPSCASMVDVISPGVHGSTAVYPSAPLTPTLDGDFIWEMALKINTGGNSYGTVTCPPGQDDVMTGRFINAGVGAPQHMLCAKIQTTATATSGNHAITGTQSNNQAGRFAVALKVQDASGAPSSALGGAVGGTALRGAR